MDPYQARQILLAVPSHPSSATGLNLGKHLIMVLYFAVGHQRAFAPEMGRYCGFEFQKLLTKTVASSPGVISSSLAPAVLATCPNINQMSDCTGHHSLHAYEPAWIQVCLAMTL